MSLVRTRNTDCFCISYLIGYASQNQKRAGVQNRGIGENVVLDIAGITQFCPLEAIFPFDHRHTFFIL